MNFITSMTMVDHIIGSAPFVYEGDFTKGIKKGKELGFDGVELHIADPAMVDISEMEETFAVSNTRLTAIGTGRAYVNDGLSITDESLNIRRAAIERLEGFLEMAGKFRAAVIVGCMRGNISSSDKLPQAMEWLQKSMRYLDVVAGELGVNIVFEPINRYENNFLCNMAEIVAFIRENDLKNTGILMDTFHANIEEEDICASIRQNANEIQYVHIADSNRLYPGGGHLDFEKILKTLDEAGYHGVLSAECLPFPSKTMSAVKWIENMKAIMEI